MFNTLGNTIPTDWARRYLFDGSGNSTTGSNNATVTNPVWIKPQRMYQNQCLSWGATTSCTYASVTYTNSYIWIYASGVWTFTKNSSKVTATALNGVNGERYAGLTFFNRTLTTDEEQLLQLEGLKLLGPTNVAKYPKLFEGLVGYWDFRGTAHNLVDGSLPTTNTASLTTDRFGNSNSSYSFNGSTTHIDITNTIFNISQSNSASWHFIINSSSINTNQYILGTTQGGGNNYGIYFELFNSKIRIQFYPSGGGGTVQGGVSTLLSNTYYYLDFVLSGGILYAYINGTLDFQVTLSSSGNLYDGNTKYVIGGAYNRGTSQYINNFIGKIDEVFIIKDRALSASEFKLLYNLTSQDYIYPTQSYDLPNLRDGLVLDLNEQGKDLSGNGNNATLVNSPTVVIQGRAKGFSYNGSNQYISMPSGFGNALGSSFTISFWIKPSRTSGNEGLMRNGISYGGSKNGWDIYRNPTSNSINFRSAYLSVIDNQLLTGNKITTGVWHFCVFTYNGTQSKWYYNGILNDTQSVTGSITGTGDANRSIGGPLFADATKYFQGNLINPKLYNRVLSDKEIQQMYYSQKGNYIY